MKKRRLKKSSLVLFAISLILISTIIYSSYKIIIWFIENKKIEAIEKEIIEQVVIEDVEDNEDTIIIETFEGTPKEDPYWDYIMINLIDVDFTKLKETNNNTKGWIYVGGTNVNYPFVQHSDNKFYLNHSFDKKYNSAGWVFADYRNKLDGTDKNIIIYAHGRLDKSMFGSLRSIIKETWYNNLDNHIVKISTETENTLWQVFSVYKIPTTNDYIQTDFSSDEQYLNFLNKLKNRSKFNFNTTVSANDQILTLSTCHDDKTKIVLHAKLIKKEKKEA
jgi:sortase B